MAFDPANNLTAIVGAIGALGTAAFGLVDAIKVLPGGGISNCGYSFIERAIQRFYVGKTRRSSEGDVKSLFDVLHGNWINGIALADQKAIAKSLIKVRLNEDTAQAFAKAADLADRGKDLETAATKVSAGDKLNSSDTNVLGRFDLALTAILDDCYQHADQKYRNSSKVAAMIVATLLAVVGGWTLSDGTSDYMWTPAMWQSFLCGLLATPLAPITKDLASALTAGVKVAQAIRK